ncbi:RNA polymerase I-specific transcription initiation factor RRN3, partial [Tremellales sp. Uapishka_1]
MSIDASGSRSSSLAGKKRPREVEGDGKPKASRRTKSTGDAREGRNTKDKEAFQRGLIGVFVPKALQESHQGNMTHYNDLLAHFLPTPITPNLALSPLLPLLRAITSHVSLLTPDLHSSLISAIINLPWATGDEKFVKAFVGWTGVLVSAQPGWAKEVVGMAIRGLTWQPVFIATTSVPPITRRIFHARHHLLLSHLLSLIPTLPNVLQPLLVRHFPHKREPEVAQTTWVRNCCELIGYCPELGGRVWGGIVDRMLRIDVELSHRSEEDDDDEDSDDEDAPLAGPSRLVPPASSLDPFDLLISNQFPLESPSTSPSSDSDSDGSDSDPDPDELSSVDGDGSDDEGGMDTARLLKDRIKKRTAIKSMREKLDGMLCYFYQHLQECMGGKSGGVSAADIAALGMSSSSSSDSATPTIDTPTYLPRRPPPTPAQSLSHFQTLLNLFSRQILPTAATQHVPFLLFFTSSFSPSHTDLFLGLLVSQALYATSTTNPTSISQPISLNQRIAATVYIGSVVCRARFVSDDQARMVTTYLLAFMDGKLHQSIKEKQEELPLFYAVTQAVMLIFCFRWRAFTTDKEREGSEVLGDLDMFDEDEADGSGAGEGKWIRDLDVLQRALTSDLNPLLGCNPIIVDTFAKVAHSTNFAYCFSIMEANQQLSQSHARSTLAQNGAPLAPSRTNSASTILSNSSLIIPRHARQSNIDAGLDNYFPFDPYDLKRSNGYIQDIYRTWDEVAADLGNDSESESGSDSGEEDGSDSEMEEEKRSFPKIQPKIGSLDRRQSLMRDGGLSSSLEGMSISPMATMHARFGK